jgi:anti-anti-sigma factor
MLLEIRVEKTSDDIPVINLKGEIDLQTCGEFRDVLRELIEQHYRHIVIDFANVPYIDSAALGVLVVAVRKVREDDGAMYLVATTPFVRRAFEITRLARDFALPEDMETALEHIRAKMAVVEA